MNEALVDIRKHPAYDGILEACRVCLDQVRRGSWMIVKGYWQIGKVIVRYEQEGTINFNYGTNTMRVLAQDLGFRDPTLLYRMKEAAIRYPTEESLEQARLELLSAGRDAHWTNFRNRCLPRDTIHPEKYGGAENVVDNVMARMETFLIDLEKLQEMYSTLDDDAKEEADGVLLKVGEIGTEFMGSQLKRLPYGKDAPARSEDYLDYIRSLECCVCDEPPPNDPHHVQRAGLGGVGMKPSDYFAIPVCRDHHDGIHDNSRYIEDYFGIDLWNEVSKCLMNYICGGS